MTNKLSQFFIITSLVILISSCGLSGGPVSGKVIDETTGKTIEGAIVVIKWTGQVGLIHGTTICYFVETTKTNENGEYKVPNQENNHKEIHMGNKRRTAFAYKEGYEWSTIHHDNIEYLKPFKGTPEERLNYLARVAQNARCNMAKSLILPNEAIVVEALTLMDAKNYSDVTSSLLFGLDDLKYGGKIAHENLAKRRSSSK